MQGKGEGGGARGSVPRTRLAEASRGSVSRTRVVAARVCSSELSRIVAAARFSSPFTQEVEGGWVWNARIRVPRASRVWDWLTEYSFFSLDAIETRQFPSF